MVEFAKIRVTRKLDDERAMWCSFSTFSNIKTDITKFRPFPVVIILVRPSTW